LDEIPHYLVDICSIDEEFDVAQFNDQALASIKNIHERSRVPIVVGGSGMYMEIILDGIFKCADKNESLRKDLKEEAKEFGNEHLYRRLLREDPAAAKKIHPNDVRRVVRALEVSMQEKAPISKVRADREGIWGKYDVNIFCLNKERAVLYEDINRRVERMFEDGLIDEVRRLNGAQWSMTAEKIIGIGEVRTLLKGECSLEKAKERMKINTRNLAKRQLTWFRRDQRLQWIIVGERNDPESVAQDILNRIGKTSELSRHE